MSFNDDCAMVEESQISINSFFIFLQYFSLTKIKILSIICVNDVVNTHTSYRHLFVTNSKRCEFYAKIMGYLHRAKILLLKVDVETQS